MTTKIDLDQISPPPTIDPLDISGCVLLLRADALTATDGDAIATWADESTASNDATQGTGSAQPTYRENVWNGKPALYFDGGDRLVLASNPDDAASTLFVVVADRYTNAYKCAVNTKRYNVMVNLSGAIVWGVYNSQANAIGMLRGFELNILSLTYATPNVYHTYTNGLKYSFSAGSDAGSVNPGIGSDASNFLTGHVAEVILYNSVLSDANREAVELYLSVKYNIYVGSRAQ